MTAPLTPAACDLRDFPRMMVDVPRLFASEFNAASTDAEWRYGVTLWLKAFHQKPAASLPDDDAQLARLCELGRDVKTWRKIREGALRNWVRCDDGRLYHPVVAEVALAAWLEKLARRLSSGSGNAKRWGVEFDPSQTEAEIAEAKAMLASLDPQAKALNRRQPRAAAVPPGEPDASQPDPAGTPEAIPAGSQERGRGTGRVNTSLPEGAPSAEPVDPNKEAWDRAAALLTGRGRMKPTQARAFFGRLLRDHTLDGRDLLASVVAAEGTGTADPQAYLTRAAAAVAQRRGKPSSTGPAGWGDAEWTVALRMLDERDAWPETNGPRPGEPGCLVPAPLLVRGVG